MLSVNYGHPFDAVLDFLCLVKHACTDAGQSGDASRSYYQGQKPDLRLALEKQGNNDVRPQTHNKDADHGYEKVPFSQTFEGLEQKFLDDITKLAKELNDAEDAENVRHREVSWPCLLKCLSVQ